MSEGYKLNELEEVRWVASTIVPVHSLTPLMDLNRPLHILFLNTVRWIHGPTHQQDIELVIKCAKDNTKQGFNCDFKWQL